jgi:hypothetical protein
MRAAYEMSVGDAEGMKLLGRPRCRWENTTVDLKEIVCESADWIQLDQDRVHGWTVIKRVMNLWVL